MRQAGSVHSSMGNMILYMERVHAAQVTVVPIFRQTRN